MASNPIQRISRRVLLAPPAVLGLALALDAPRRGSARQTLPSPTLLVRGETELSTASPMAWRVVRDTAERGASALFEERALGFAVASGPFTSLLLTDGATGSAFRLDPGEAAFVREGTVQRRESLVRTAQSYLRIGLVEAAGAGDSGGDRLLFAGPPFPAPAGPVTVVLHRVALEVGNVFPMSPGLGAVLVLVEQGELELEPGDASPRERLQTVVGSDTSYAIRSVIQEATLTGARDATSVLIAAIE